VNSQRQIVRSSSIIGGSKIIEVFIGLVKTKIAAVLLGPAGIGLIGIYQNIMMLASTLAGCGVSQSGVRQLAMSLDEPATLNLIQRTMWLANLMLGIVGMMVLWTLRDSISQWAFGDIGYADNVGWLSCGVLISLMAGSQLGVLQGLRHIEDLAKITVISAIISCVVGVTALYLIGEASILWIVLSPPAISCLVTSYYTPRLLRSKAKHDRQQIHKQWQAMFKLGLPIMFAALLPLITQLLIRSMVVNKIGIEASGYFQAAWVISVSYIGLVLGAMGSDYFPRLSGVIKNRKNARRLVNDQAEITLLLASPILLGMITFSPWIINLLYTESFAPSSRILQWQVLGDILKVSGFPMGFIVLALGRGDIFIGTQLTWCAMYLGAISLGITNYGLIITGVGFFIAYLVQYLLITIVAFKLIGFRLDRRNIFFTLVQLFLSGTILFFSYQSLVAGLLAGILLTSVVSTYSFRRLDTLINAREWLKTKFS